MVTRIIPSIGDNSAFHEIYEIDVPFTQDDRTFFGIKNPRTCRFCDKTKGETTFKKKAHLIPELMGNKIFFSYFECDVCNALFSKYEDSFANFGGILNTLSMLQGKRGVPKHKHKHEGFEALVIDGKVHLRLTPVKKGQYEFENKLMEEFDSVKIDTDNETIYINTIKHSYIPKLAFKVFAKIGLSLLRDSDLQEFRSAITWLTTPDHVFDETDHPLFHVYRRIQPKLFPQPWGFLFRKRRELMGYQSPEKVLLIFYGHYAYQIFLPFNKLDDSLWNRNEIILPIENHLVELDGSTTDYQFEQVDLNSNKKRRGETDSFSLGIKPI